MKSAMIKLIIALVILLICTSVFIVGALPQDSDKTPVQLGVTEETDTSAVAQYEKVAQTKELTMFADMRNGWFAIKNNITGYFWYSHPNDVLTDRTTVGVNRQNFQSDIVVYYLSKDAHGETSSYTEASVSSNAGAIREGTVSVEKIENGIRVVYDFYTISTRIPVEYTISNGKLKAKIDGKSILEQKKFYDAVKDTATEEQIELIQDSYITSIWLLPVFGAATSEDNGFVFVPDGSGAYINYTPSKETTEVFSAPVYGGDFGIDEYGVKTEEFSSVTTDIDICMPVFGGVKNGNGYFSIITKGAATASLKAFKAGRANNYTGVSSQVDYRHATFSTIGGRKVQTITDSFKTLPDFEVEYHIISKDSVSYMDFAEIYKEYLKEEYNFEKKDYIPSASFKVFGAIDVDGTILGFPSKRVESLTNVSQLKSIIKDIKDISDINVAVNYIGWNNNGVQNSKITDEATPIKQLGNKEGLNNLISEISKNGDSIYLDADLVTFRKSGRGVSKNSDSIQTAFGKASLIRKFMYSTFTYENNGLYVLTPSKLENVFNKYYKSFKSLDSSAGLSFNSISQNCYSNFNPKATVSRIDTLNYYKKILSNLKGKSVSAENANDYMWQYADRIYSAPVSSSRQSIYDGEIPFYQLVTHGYIALTSQPINQAANRTAAFLRAVETGSELLFYCMAEDSSLVNGTDYDYLYSTSYSLWRNDFESLSSKYSELLKKISNCEIVDYKAINSDVYKTVYDNGIVVYVNYSKEDVSLENGLVVKSENFEYEEKAQ